MHWLDSTFLAVLAAAAVLGAYSGLLMQVFRMVGFVVALYATMAWHERTTTWLQEGLLRGAEAEVSNGAGYVVVFLGTYLTIFLATLLLERFVRAAQLQSMNRSLGAILAVAKMSLLMGIICYGLRQIEHEPTNQLLAESAVAPLLSKGVEHAMAAVPEEYRDDWLKNLHKLRDAMPAVDGKQKDNFAPPPLGSKIRM